NPMGGVNLWFTSDGAEIGVGVEGLTATIWDLRNLRQELAKIGLDWDGPPFPPASQALTGPMTLAVEVGDVDLSSFPAKGNATQRLTYFNAWIKREPDLIDLYYRRASVLMEVKQFDAAAADLARFLAARPHDAPALSLQASALARLGQSEASTQAMEKLLAL